MHGQPQPPIYLILTCILISRFRLLNGGDLSFESNPRDENREQGAVMLLSGTAYSICNDIPMSGKLTPVRLSKSTVAQDCPLLLFYHWSARSNPWTCDALLPLYPRRNHAQFRDQ